MRHEPPFDGNPCPMCPMWVRNLAALMHNLTSRMDRGASLCKISDTLASIANTVAAIEQGNLINEQSPEELRNLLAVAKQMPRDAFWLDVEKARTASAAVRPLSDAHFADPLHSHGR